MYFRLLFSSGVLALVMCLPTRPPSSISSICRVGISELHFPDTGRPFIEFYEHCTRRKTGLKTLKALRGYKLLLVTSDREQILMVVDLGHESLRFRDEEKFYVLNARNSDTDQGTISTPAVQTVSPTKGDFPVELGKSYGLFLIRSSDTRVKDFKLQRQFREVFKERSLDPAMKAIITSNLVDFVSFCTSSSCTRTTPFASILGHLGEFWKEAKDFPASKSSSISYCGPNSIEYRREHFRSTTPSPGEPNRCMNVPTAAITTTKPMITSSSTPESELDCTETSAINSGATGFRTLQRRENRVNFLKKGVGKLDEHSAFMCKESLPDSGELLKRQFISSWVQVSILESKCFFHCRVCSTFFEAGFRPDLNKPRKRQKITKDGIHNAKAHNNHEALMDHTNHPVHLVASRLMEEIQTNPNSVFDIVGRYEQTEFEIFKPTIDLILLAYTEIVSDVPFSGHETFVESLKLMGLNLGSHHYDNAGYLAITKTISEDFRLTLLRYLLEAQNPFSLILDGSHDNTNNHLFCVLIQSFEADQPMTYFYRLIHLKKGETSSDIVSALISKIDEDDDAIPGFKDFFLTKIYGMSSDGASVMTGVRNSVHAKLKTLTKRPILLSKCMAHSLELATKQALTHVGSGTYVQSIEGKANKIFTYYMSRGSLRWNRLNAMGDSLGIKVKRFKAHYPVRWSSSHFEVVTSLWHNFHVALKDVNSAKSDRRTTLKARNSASKIFGILSDKRFPLYLNEMIDYLGTYKSLSLEFEKSRGTLIGKRDIVLHGITNLEGLKRNIGPNVTTFLKSCKCTGLCDGTCTVEQYESCGNLYCEGTKLETGSDTDAVFLQTRNDLYRNSISQLHGYFDFDRMEAYDILDLRTAPDGSGVTKFCNFHKWDATVCYKFRSEFTQFSAEVRSKYAEDLDTKEPVELWSIVLQGAGIQYSSFLNNTLRGVLTIPAGSADAERVFSLMTRIKSRERSSLSPENLESLIRIKINGPRELALFDAFYYATVFLGFHVRSDDCSVGSRKKSSTSDNSKWSRSKIF